jgi:hypothetical protein
MDTLIVLFCLVEDFCQMFIPTWNQQLIQSGSKHRNRQGQLSPSEIITLFIYFHQLRFRDFKTYYLQYAKVHLASYFPKLVSYPRFVTLLKSVLVPLCFFVQTLRGQKTGIYFVDSLILKACHIKREKQHCVFEGIAKKGKSSIGWFLVLNCIWSLMIKARLWHLK